MLLTTQLMALDCPDRVLKIGIGSRHHAAVRTELADIVCLIEAIANSSRCAVGAMPANDYLRIAARQGDGKHS